MKVVLTIAGSDSSGGAGIQADLKTFEAFGVFGTSALTVLTAQNTAGVRSISEVTPEFVTDQLESIREDFDIAAIKVGMLFSTPIIEAVGTFLASLKETPIVIDPVCVSKAGSPLLQEDAIEALKGLFQYASVITPNRHEAALLFGYEFGDSQSLERIAAAPCPVLIKHEVLGEGASKKSIDQLIFAHQRRTFQTLQIDSNNTHGTGCSYSSAIAANLALGLPLDHAISRSKEFIYQAMLSAPNIGSLFGPINHKAGGIHVQEA